MEWLDQGDTREDIERLQVEEIDQAHHDRQKASGKAFQERQGQEMRYRAWWLHTFDQILEYLRQIFETYFGVLFFGGDFGVWFWF